MGSLEEDRKNAHLRREIRGKLKKIRDMTDHRQMVKEISAVDGHYKQLLLNNALLAASQKIPLYLRLRQKILASWHQERTIWGAIAIQFFAAWGVLHFKADVGWTLYWVSTALVLVSFLVGLCGTVNAKMWNYILGLANLVLQAMAAYALKKHL